MKKTLTTSNVLKSCTLVDKISIEQKKVIQTAHNNVQFKSALEKGNYGEIIESLLLKNCAAQDMLRTPCTSLTSPGHHGLDGLWKYKNLIIITEAKYGSGRLIKTKSGMQMSDEWIDPRLVNKPYTKASRLDIAAGGSAQKIINSLKNRDVILLKLLIHVSPKNEIRIHLIDTHGKISCRDISL